MGCRSGSATKPSVLLFKSHSDLETVKQAIASNFDLLEGRIVLVNEIMEPVSLGSFEFRTSPNYIAQVYAFSRSPAERNRLLSVSPQIMEAFLIRHDDAARKSIKKGYQYEFLEQRKHPPRTGTTRQSPPPVSARLRSLDIIDFRIEWLHEVILGFSETDISLPLLRLFLLMRAHASKSFLGHDLKGFSVPIYPSDEGPYEYILHWIAHQAISRSGPGTLGKMPSRDVETFGAVVTDSGTITWRLIIDASRALPEFDMEDGVLSVEQIKVSIPEPDTQRAVG